MKNHLLLIYGDDTYTSLRTLLAIKTKYADASLGTTNLVKIDGATTTVDELVRQIFTPPFLAKSRLIIIENLLTLGKAAVQEKVAEILERIPQSSVVIFFEQGTPDKRGKLYKLLAKHARTHVFPKLEGATLNQWIRQFAEKSSSAIDSQAINLLVQAFGGDLWRLSNELTKAAAYTKNITSDTIRELTDLPVESNIFRLLDAVAAKNTESAFKEFSNLIKNGEPPIYIMAMIGKTLRDLALVKSGAKPDSNWQIHPFVLQKTRSQVKNFDEKQIGGLYKNLARIDYHAKIGTIEPETGVALFIAQAAR